MCIQQFDKVFISYQVVVNSLLSAIPEIGNVSLVCLIFWLIFSVMGVQFFGGRFYKCLDRNGEILPHTTVANKTSCLAMNYTWRNSDINFDNSLSGFLALFQVVSFRIVAIKCKARFFGPQSFFKKAFLISTNAARSEFFLILTIRYVACFMQRNAFGAYVLFLFRVLVILC